MTTFRSNEQHHPSQPPPIFPKPNPLPRCNGEKVTLAGERERDRDMATVKFQKVPHEMLNEKYTQPNQWQNNWNKHHALMNACWNFCLKCLLSSIEWLEILRSLWICLARDSNMQQSPLYEPLKQCCYASVSSLSTHFTKLKNHGTSMNIFHMNHAQ